MPYGAVVVDYFALPVEAERFYGSPHPTPGARVSFEPDKLLAARGRSEGGSKRPVSGEDGLVVHKDPLDLLFWPASLWRVEDLNRPVPPGPGNRSVRVLGFTVIEQAPTWLAAGPHGDAVEWVVNVARTLTAEQAEALAVMPDEEEEPVRAAMWKRWTRLHRSGSPVGISLFTIAEAVEEAARRVSPSLFAWSEEDGGEVLTDPVWLKAGHAASAAALGLGALEFLSAEEAETLARRWTSVFGTPESPIGIVGGV